MLAAAEKAERVGGGVVTLAGKPIYMPQIKQARTLVEQAEMMPASLTPKVSLKPRSAAMGRKRSAASDQGPVDHWGIADVT